MSSVAVAAEGAGDSIGVVDTSSGRWYLVDPVTHDVTSFYFGDPGDLPLVGDWDCNGVDTVGVYRQSDAHVYLRNSNSQGIADIRFFFGDPGDVAVAGDFNGDGCDTVSLYRPRETRFYIVNELGGDSAGLGAADFSFQFGNPGDVPISGDWDGDGIDEFGLHRESAGLFYYRNTLDTGIADESFLYGDRGDRAIAGDWVPKPPSGTDTVAVFRPSNRTFYLKFGQGSGPADVTYLFGSPDNLPVAGRFGSLPGGDERPPLEADLTTELTLNEQGKCAVTMTWNWGTEVWAHITASYVGGHLPPIDGATERVEPTGAVTTYTHVFVDDLPGIRHRVFAGIAPRERLDEWIAIDVFFIDQPSCQKVNKSG